LDHRKPRQYECSSQDTRTQSSEDETPSKPRDHHRSTLTAPDPHTPCDETPHTVHTIHKIAPSEPHAHILLSPKFSTTPPTRDDG
jgi:hypothetical protein